MLRVILNQFPEISAPHPPHILKNFMPVLDQYGDLNHAENFRQLVSDVKDWIKLNPVPWDHVKLDVDEIVDRCTTRTLTEVFKVVYTLKAEADKAEIWCCKSTFNVNYYSQLENSGLNPFYIHLVRDGRDVALSFQKAPVGHKHIYHLALAWKQDQLKALDVKSKAQWDRFITVKYEDLIHEPEKIVHLISDRLSVPYNEKALNYYKSEESLHTAGAGQMWANLTKPIIAGNFCKYKSAFSDDDLDLFDGVAGDMLEQFGYSRYGSRINNISTQEVQMYDKLNQELILQASREMDQDVVLKRERQAAILARFRR